MVWIITIRHKKPGKLRFSVFFRNLFQVPQTVPTVALYLETGSFSIGTILKIKRINYLHYLVKLESSEMLSKFFHAQWENPVELDWTVEVRRNLIELELPTNLDVIKQMSKNSFKSLVKKQARKYEFLRFLDIKKNKSKMKNLFYQDLKIQDTSVKKYEHIPSTGPVQIQG